MGIHHNCKDIVLDYARQRIDGTGIHETLLSWQLPGFTISRSSLPAMVHEAEKLIPANMTENTKTATFVEAYMIQKLADFGVDRPEPLGLHSTAFELCPYHRTLKFSEMAESKVNAILADLDLLDTLKNLHISKNTLLRTFLYITETLFGDDEMSCWKIVTLVDCAAQMAVMCVDREMPNMVENLFTWTSMFMDRDDIKAWIEDNGGWEFLTNGMEKHLEQQAGESDGWSSAGGSDSD